jgi:sulfite reductase (NADPH) flavoprotein alpha-component
MIAENIAGETTGASRAISILYGSQTGTTEMIASELQEVLEEVRISVERVVSLEDLDPNDLETLETVIILCSTYGEGEMPDPAKEFYDKFLKMQGTPLSSLKYAVLAFGDTGPVP